MHPHKLYGFCLKWRTFSKINTSILCHICTNFVQLIDLCWCAYRSLQPKLENPCKKNQCDHLCLLSHSNSKGFICKCRYVHIMLKPNVTPPAWPSIVSSLRLGFEQDVEPYSLFLKVKTADRARIVGQPFTFFLLSGLAIALWTARPAWRRRIPTSWSSSPPRSWTCPSCRRTSPPATSLPSSTSSMDAASTMIQGKGRLF